jgi:hypothetical protein
MPKQYFLEDGYERALKGLGPEMAAERLKIQEEIESKFADQLGTSGLFRRLLLRIQMKRELNRRLALIIKDKAPPYALYGKHNSNIK